MNGLETIGHHPLVNLDLQYCLDISIRAKGFVFIGDVSCGFRARGVTLAWAFLVVRLEASSFA